MEIFFKILEYDLDIHLIKKSEIPDEMGIFFIETSFLNANGILNLTARQACSIESAAAMHSNLTVHLLVFGNSSQTLSKYISTYLVSINNYYNLVVFLDVEKSSAYVQALLHYDNIKIKMITVEEYVKETIVESFIESGSFSKTNYLTAHLSDVLRLVTMWKYGGIYLDLDVIILQRLDLWSKNFACLENSKDINNAVLGFDRNIGKNLLETIIL